MMMARSQSCRVVAGRANEHFDSKSLSPAYVGFAAARLKKRASGSLTYVKAAPKKRSYQRYFYDLAFGENMGGKYYNDDRQKIVAVITPAFGSGGEARMQHDEDQGGNACRTKDKEENRDGTTG